MKVCLSISLILMFAFCAFGQPAEQKRVIRWIESSSPKECCHIRDNEGIIETYYNSANLQYVVTLFTDADDDFIIAYLAISNTSNTPVVVNPANFSIRVTEPINKTYSALDPVDVGKAIQKRERKADFSTFTGKRKLAADGSQRAGVSKPLPNDQNQAGSFFLLALQLHTLLKDKDILGSVFFKKKKLADGLILSFTIGDTTYEVPYGSERTKPNNK